MKTVTIHICKTEKQIVIQNKTNRKRESQTQFLQQLQKTGSKNPSKLLKHKTNISFPYKK